MYYSLDIPYHLSLTYYMLGLFICKAFGISTLLFDTTSNYYDSDDTFEFRRHLREKLYEIVKGMYYKKYNL